MLTGFFSGWCVYTGVVGKAAGRFMERVLNGKWVFFHYVLLWVIVIIFVVNFLKMQIRLLTKSGLMVAIVFSGKPYVLCLPLGAFFIK